MTMGDKYSAYLPFACGMGEEILGCMEPVDLATTEHSQVPGRMFPADPEASPPALRTSVREGRKLGPRIQQRGTRGTGDLHVLLPK